ASEHRRARWLSVYGNFKKVGLQRGEVIEVKVSPISPEARQPAMPTANSPSINTDIIKRVISSPLLAKRHSTHTPTRRLRLRQARNRRASFNPINGGF